MTNPKSKRATFDKNNRRFYLILNSSGYFSTFLFGMIFVLMDASFELKMASLIFSMIYILLGFAIRWVSDLLILFRISVMVALIAFSAQIMLTGGVMSPSLPQLMIIPILTLFYKPKSDRYFFFALTICIALAITVLSLLGIGVANGIPLAYRPMYTLSVFFYVAVIIFTFIMLFRNLVTSTNRKLSSSMDHLKRATQQLVDTEKMASLGQMMAGIAHEINNPINYIRGSSQILDRSVSELNELEQLRHQNEKMLLDQKDPETFQKKYHDLKQEESILKEKIQYEELFSSIKELNETIDIGTKKTAEIVSSLGMYARNSNGHQEAININRALQTTIKLLNHQIKDRIDIQLDLSDELPFVIGNESRISQVFLNIMTNAVHALDEGGIININSTLLPGGNLVRVSIGDNGPGIPKEVMPKIFDPFFTTKEVGKGTGLGLSLSKTIVEEHKGQLTFSTDEDGTTFTIVLPSK